MSELRDKRERFCREYLVDLNATQAAIRSGYSPKTARSQGQRLLTNADVQARIEELNYDRAKRTGINADRVIEQIGAMAFGDLRSVFDGTRLMRPDEWSDEAAALVAGIEVSTVNRGEGEVEYIAKVRSTDRLKALELLGRHFKLFTDKVESTGKDGGPIETKNTTTLDVSNLSNEQLRALSSISIHEE